MSSFYKGKVILTGEHSVVHGHSAILASLNLGVKVTIKEGSLTDQQKADPYLQHLLQIFAKHDQTKECKVSIKINSTLPMRSGLGSSAAFAAAVLSELSKFCDYELSDSRLYDLVLEAENFIHGHSSGADPGIVVYGGLIAFKKGQIQHLSPLILKDRVFFLIDSGAATESTGEMIAKVAERSENQVTLQEIGELSQKMIDDLQNGLFDSKLLNQNQLLLEQIGVVGERAKKIINQLQELGADCKITGAGGVKTGSGFILAFYKNPDEFEENLQAMGLPFFKTHLGGENNEKEN